ncbi:MAG: hypothetical protein PHO37_04875 [Kiritimatiellae bacterium]|nr:hypothetical protein [Kiritimatiellia bacterium]
MPKQRYKNFFIACAIMFTLDAACASTGAAWLLQLPSGWLTALFLGAGARVESGVIMIAVYPPLSVSAACSGCGFFAFLCGMGGAFFCGRNWLRWLALFPLSYLIALLANTARIVMAWHFHRLCAGHLPGWLREYCHMGIGLACFLSITALLLWWMVIKNAPRKEETV